MLQIKCNKKIPCERCLRLGMDCHPSQQKPLGRPLKLHKTKAQIAAERAAATEGLTTTPPPPPPSSLAAASSNFPDGDNDGFASEGRGKGSPVYLALSCELTQYRHVAHVVSTAFSKLKAQGKVVDSRAAAMANCWALYNRRHNVDATLGMYDVIAHYLGSSLLVPAPGPPVPCPTHGPVEEDGDTVIPAHLKLLDDSLAAVTYLVSTNGRFEVYCNQLFSERFMDKEDLQHRMNHYKVVPVLLWSSVLAPQEVNTFYAEMLAYSCSNPTTAISEVRKICMCVDKNGRRMLAVVRVRYVVIEGGKSHAAVLSVFSLPPSRYILVPPELEGMHDHTQPSCTVTPPQANSPSSVAVAMFCGGSSDEEEGGNGMVDPPPELSQCQWLDNVFEEDSMGRSGIDSWAGQV